MFVLSTRFFVCVTVIFWSPPFGRCADRAHGAHGAARRRRDRRLRAFLKHERMTVAMNLATVQHHSFKKSAVMEVGVQVGSPLCFASDFSSADESDSASDETSSVTENVAPALAATVAPPTPVIGRVSTPAVPVIEQVTSTSTCDRVCGARTCQRLHLITFSCDWRYRKPAIFYLCCGGFCLTSRWFFSFRC